ncbi:MAG TPA: SIS domain-containing protein [Planctomycetota bacterium]|nr:SIS domain-containing protein [Planctomycetota bacterium]
MRETIRRIAEAAAASAAGADAAATARFVDALQRAPRVFLVGAGRSGLVARGFAMRLRHLGREAYVAGEASTPAAAKGDLVVACTASSRTATTVAIARSAIRAGIDVAVVTTSGELAAWNDAAIAVGLPVSEASAGAAPLGSVFELAAQLLLDAAVVELMTRLGVDEGAMRARHATLE